jgi:hypothetical protein
MERGAEVGRSDRVARLDEQSHGLRLPAASPDHMTKATAKLK